MGNCRSALHSGRPIDTVTLGEALGDKWKAIAADVDLGAYLEECARQVPAPRESIHYARIVREQAIRRALMLFAAELEQKAREAPASWTDDWIDELIAAAEYEFAQIVARMIRKPEPSKRDTINTVLWRLRRGLITNLPTGFETLDTQFGGFAPGHLTMLAARTSKGKTALATYFARHLSRQGKRVAFFSLEMPAEDMWQRALALEAEVNTFRIQHGGGASREEWAALERAGATLIAEPLEIFYRPALRLRELRLDCKRLMRDGPLGLVVVDYFNLIRGERRERERFNEMREVVIGMKDLAGELGTPILLLAQLNREVGEHEQPKLSDLRDTGAGEEHPSNVLMLWEPPTEATGYTPIVRVNLVVAKQRNGPPGYEARLDFNRQHGTFTEVKG